MSLWMHETSPLFFSYARCTFEPRCYAPLDLRTAGFPESFLHEQEGRRQSDPTGRGQTCTTRASEKYNGPLADLEWLNMDSININSISIGVALSELTLHRSDVDRRWNGNRLHSVA